MGTIERTSSNAGSTGITRRGVLRLLGLTGSLPLLTTLLAACGGSSQATPAATAASTSAALANTPVTAGGTPLSTFITPVAVASRTVSTAASTTTPRQAGTPTVGAPAGRAYA